MKLSKDHFGKLCLALAISSIAVTTSSHAKSADSSPSQGISLTVYNQNFGIVRDVRNIELKEGENHLRLEDIAAQIDPTSVSLVDISAPNTVLVKEQNYQYDVISPNSILGRSIGKRVKFINTGLNGQTSIVEGTLLNAPLVNIADTDGNITQRSQGLVVKTADGILLNPVGQAELTELPDGLIAKPSLLWKLESSKAGLHKCEIGYQTRGLNWKCDYVAVISDKDNKADLTSWVTLNNQSGATYKDAVLKLFAGDVHQVTTPRQPIMFAAIRGRANSAAPQFQEESFSEYHLYTLQNKTDVNDNETKQISLFSANDIPVKKLYVFEPDMGIVYPMDGDILENQRHGVKVRLELANSEANHLGMPLPKGKVRAYKRDQDGALELIGEDSINHTAKDEKIRLYLGDAFDVVGEQHQTNMQQTSSKSQRVSYEAFVRNHKKSAVTVTLVAHAQGDWKIISSSVLMTKKDSRTLECSLDIGPDSETKVDYTIESRY